MGDIGVMVTDVMVADFRIRAMVTVTTLSYQRFLNKNL
jgi:hypothetical protein